MLRDAILHKGFSGFLASLLFWVEAPLEKPDLRHWSDSLQEAAPTLADFEAYVSETPLQVSESELKESSIERKTRLALLDEAMDGEASQGQRYRMQRERVSLLQEEMSFRRFQRRYDYFQKSNHWRALDMDRAKLAEKDNEAQDMAFKALNISRDLVKEPFEEDSNAALLIRAMVRLQHSNTSLFFEQFKKKFSQSPEAPRVYHLMAELACEQKRWADAEALLKLALENKDYAERPYTVFRLAWVHLQRPEADEGKRQEAYEKAAVALRLSLKLLQEKPQKTGLFPLREQALIDLAWVFAMQKKAQEEALAFFSKENAELAYGDFVYYGAIEADRKGAYAEAESNWKLLNEISTESLDLPRILLSQAEHSRLQGDQNAMIQRYKDVQAILQPTHPWAEAFEDRSAEWESIRLMTAHHLSFAAQMAYLEGESAPEAVTDASKGRRTRAEALAASEQLYKLYEEWYPNGSAREEGKYYKALSLYFKGLLQDSLKLLTAMASDEKSPMRRDAAYNAVLVAAAWDEKQKLPKLPELGKARKPVPLSPSKQVLVERTESFLQLFPDATEKAPFEFMLAQMYFEFGHYMEAIPRYTALILSFPATEQGENSLHTLLQYYVETAQWDVLIPLCEDWMKNKSLRAAGHRKILRQTLEYAQSQKAAG